jgi:hypothetical protein
MKAVILYPVFLECLAFCTGDSFWSYVFEDMAYGRPPFGTYMNHNYLCCAHRGHEFSYRIDTGKPVEKIFHEVSTLLREKMGLVSQEESEKRRRAMQPSSSQAGHDNKKIVRETALEQFVLRQKFLYKYSNGFVQKLFSVLLIGFLLKTISLHDIVYKGDRIENISCVEFHPSNRVVIRRNLYALREGAKHAREPSPVKGLLSMAWAPYLGLYTHLQGRE